ncbi:kinase-like domain-containing protein [Flagelloscypha sp. PMI_526]|nr:kinase-like domain-containing protein [Flagelloscypha sp. PMI_526]
MTKATFEDVIVQRKNDDVQYGSKGGATDEEAISKTLVIREAGKGFMQLRLGNCIAQGRFASAYRAMSLETGQTVIVKQVPLTQLTEENISNLMMEVEVVKKLRHPCLIKYEGIMRDENHLNLVLEYAENGSLKQTLRAFGSLNERLTASYVVKILSALQYLHQINVLHGNLKASNILTKKNGNIKLADFGLSLNRIALEGDMRRNSSEGVGSPNWTAPELFELKDVSTKSDIWSLGCTIVELMTGKPPYADIVNPMSVAFRVVEDKYPPLPENCSTVLVDFLLQCFDKDPAMRPSADVLYAHSWLVTGESIAGHSPSTRLPSRVNNYPSVINPFLRRDTIEGNEAAFDDASSIPPLPVFDVSPLASDKSARTSAATSAARSSSRSAPDDSLSAPPPRKHSLVRTTFSKRENSRILSLLSIC